MRYGNQNANIATKQRAGLLSASEERAFWASWADGSSLIVGVGDVVGRDELMRVALQKTDAGYAPKFLLARHAAGRNPETR